MNILHSLTWRSLWAQCLMVALLIFCVSCSRSKTTTRLAQSAIDPKYQNQLFWVKASGTPDRLHTWTYYFYDPSTSTKARLVKIVDGRIERVQAAEFKSQPNDSLVFDPNLNRVSSEQALQRVRIYSNEKQIKYDMVMMQLRRPKAGVAPVWHVELYQGARFAGLVFLNESDGSVVSYQASRSTASGGSGSGSSGFANDVESTFRGIGADLEEFFTGERTVDQ